MNPAVVAICGLPGSGKTTLTLALARRFGCAAYHYDDYETVTAWPVAELKRWLEEGADYSRIDLGALPRDLERAARQAAPVLLDTLVGRVHIETAPLIGLSIWIDTPPDVALARTIAEAAGRARHQPGAEADFLGWLTGWLDSYESTIARAYRVQNERVRPLCDVALDGTLPAETLCQQAAAAIEARFGGAAR